MESIIKWKKKRIRRVEICPLLRSIVFCGSIKLICKKCIVRRKTGENSTSKVASSSESDMQAADNCTLQGLFSDSRAGVQVHTASCQDLSVARACSAAWPATENERNGRKMRILCISFSTPCFEFFHPFFRRPKDHGLRTAGEGRTVSSFSASIRGAAQRHYIRPKECIFRFEKIWGYIARAVYVFFLREKKYHTLFPPSWWLASRPFQELDQTKPMAKHFVGVLHHWL